MRSTLSNEVLPNEIDELKAIWYEICSIECLSVSFDSVHFKIGGNIIIQILLGIAATKLLGILSDTDFLLCISLI